MMETILVNAPEPVLRSSFTNHSNTLTRRLISGVTCAPGTSRAGAVYWFEAPAFPVILLERLLFVVNKALPGTLGIFIEFSVKPRNAGIDIINEIQGLPIV
jgi:hypothetical protein